MTPSFDRVLATRGIDGYRQYRIPAMAVSTRGTVLAAYDGRPNLDDLPNPIDLLVRRSSDSGRTWGRQQVVRTGTGLAGFGDPSLLVDAETGRIFMFHAAGTQAGFFEAVAGLDPTDAVQHCDYSYSDDDGVSWQHRRITDQLKRDRITGIFAAAGQGIQLHAGPYRGRLIQQFVVLVTEEKSAGKAAGNILAASAYSDDHGDTWTLGEFIGPDTNENKTVGLSDGRVLLHSRATPHRLTAISTDGGHSYSRPRPHQDLPDPSDNGSVTRFDGLPVLAGLSSPGTDSWLIATHNHDTALRRNTVLKLSVDNGASWPHAVVLCQGSSAYSTAARLPDGRIGVLYERQGYREIVFTSVDSARLRAAPAAPRAGAARRNEADVVLEVELRSISPGLPEVWQTVGESVALPGPQGDFPAAVWKEMGQGYSVDAVQILSNRESQELNYGPPRPGYASGDILAFSARVTNHGSQPAAVVLTGNFNAAPAERPVQLPPGGEHLYPSLTYTVTAADVAVGSAAVSFGLHSSAAAMRASDGAPVPGREFRFDTETGDVRIGS
ncbi:sialidase family protein [Arthrobacter sp. H14-L1]|uniref:sialidase family protein n=1 Tax=Arthrobacter sp. H14-L1 TaxID=2996697 RepID=UPI00226E29DF|nr:sialidase family protein [Arthrobacter sp. H14-L1]MCY0905554.1 sialidase family protein [Arthrobacter sp. H14-L1]